MQLLQPLELQAAKTSNVNFVPTKRFFKPVFTVTAPFTVEDAELLKVRHLFDKNGNAIHFLGRYGLDQALPNVFVTLSGGGIVPVEVKAEQASSVSLFHIEKLGCRISLRIHLTEERTTTLQLLDLLAQLNKSEFQIRIVSSQTSFFEQAQDGAQPDLDVVAETGMYNRAQANVRPFKSSKLIAELLTLQVEGGYIGAWEFKFSGKTPASSGEALSVDRTVYETEEEALEEATSALRAYAMTDTLLFATAGERKSHTALLEWLGASKPAEADATPPPAARKGRGGLEVVTH